MSDQTETKERTRYDVLHRHFNNGWQVQASSLIKERALKTISQLRDMYPGEIFRIHESREVVG